MSNVPITSKLLECSFFTFELTNVLTSLHFVLYCSNRRWHVKGRMARVSRHDDARLFLHVDDYTALGRFGLANNARVVAGNDHHYCNAVIVNV